MRSSLTRAFLACLLAAIVGIVAGPIALSETALAEGAGSGFPPTDGDSTVNTCTSLVDNADLEPVTESNKETVSLLDYLLLSALLVIV